MCKNNIRLICRTQLQLPSLTVTEKFGKKRHCIGPRYMHKRPVVRIKRSRRRLTSSVRWGLIVKNRSPVYHNTIGTLKLLCNISSINYHLNNESTKHTLPIYLFTNFIKCMLTPWIDNSTNKKGCIFFATLYKQQVVVRHCTLDIIDISSQNTKMIKTTFFN